MKKEVQPLQTTGNEKISRKEALKKAGEYAAFTAASMLTILSPKESQASSGNPSLLPSWRLKSNIKDAAR